MDSLNAALLLNLLGFTVGIALYALLAAMVVAHRTPGSSKVNILLLTTSLLGLLWNLGELYLYFQNDLGTGMVSPMITALSYSALGFLPSVVVHSSQADNRKLSIVRLAAYGLSTAAAILHFRSAVIDGTAPSALGMQMLTVGSIVLAAALFYSNFRQPIGEKAVWAAALLIFAVSTLHLGGRLEGSWAVELVAHQSSLPLALAILYQNYKFAFADLFLKRAISLILLACVAFALYVLVAAPLLRYHETHDRNDVQAVSLILTLWIATALIYPVLHRFAVWLVDNVILGRANYTEFQADLARRIESAETVDGILTAVCSRLAAILTARRADWEDTTNAPDSLVEFSAAEARIFIPTAEPPYYSISLGEFQGGRRLLSDEKAMLDSAAFIVARRIDSLRVTDERYEQGLREQEFSKLTAEARLTALRSQINPHFLFNALTTIGFLIQTAPEKAFQTLLHLTQLLRGVLTSTGEFCTLGDELRLIENYLDIEKARFEERLTVEIDAAPELRSIRIPALVLQPLVENAIKHGISENVKGGTVRITAALAPSDGGSGTELHLSVFDSGAGKNSQQKPASSGVGMKNIRERLRTYYGERATLNLDEASPSGTVAHLSLPVSTAGTGI